MPPSSAAPNAFRANAVNTVHGQYAGFVSRAIGLIIDSLLVALFVIITDWLIVQVLAMVGIRIEECTVYVPITSFTTFVKDICRTIRIGLYIFSFSAFPIYFFTLWWLGGQTIGMGITGIRVIRINGERLKPHNAVRRVLGHVACILTLGIGYLVCLIDPRRQALLDKFAHTVVIYWRPDERRVLLARLRATTPGSPARRSGLPAMDAPAPSSASPGTGAGNAQSANPNGADRADQSAQPSPAPRVSGVAEGAEGSPNASVSPEAAENPQFEI